MKCVSMKRKRVIRLVLLFIVLLIGVVALRLNSNVKAALKGYFSEYDHKLEKQLSLEEGREFHTLQGMTISSTGLAFYAKIKFEKKEEDNKVGMWLYNLNYKKKYKVYNGSSLKTNLFKLGHANCMIVRSNYLYVVTCVKDWPIARYKINFKDTKKGKKVYLSERKNFKMLDINSKGIQENIWCSGIDYVPEWKSFIVKNGNKIYVGNFSGGLFKWTKRLIVDDSENIICNKKLNLRCNELFVRQGMLYNNGILYLPMHNSENNCQSIVVGYKLPKSPLDGERLLALKDTLVRITSTTYKYTFEIEGVGKYKGKMYIAVNADKGNKPLDFITTVKDFTF